MSDTYMVPSPDGWLRLPADVYRAYLIPAPEAKSANTASPSATEGQPLLVDGAEMARMANVAESFVMEAARRGRIPCVRIGRYVRFEPAATLAALGATKPLKPGDKLVQRQVVKSREVPEKKALAHGKPHRATAGATKYPARTAPNPRVE